MRLTRNQPCITRFAVFLHKNFRIAWLALFALLASAQATHFVGHLDGFFSSVHHDHGHDVEANEPANASAEHSHFSDHCHSPAILDFHSFIVFRTAVLTNSTIVVSAPEAPVSEIDYPPQLS